MFRNKLHKKYWPILTETTKDDFIYEEYWEILRFLRLQRDLLCNQIIYSRIPIDKYKVLRKIEEIDELFLCLEHKDISIDECNEILKMMNKEKIKQDESFIKVILGLCFLVLLI